MDQRATVRFMVDRAAECRLPHSSWPTRLCNISTVGCMILCQVNAIPEGTRLRLRIKGMAAINGAIIWHRGGQAGVSFDTPLTSAQLHRLGATTPDLGLVPVMQHEALDGPLEDTPQRTPGGLSGGLVKRAAAGLSSP
ncbi:MAG: PilZ domain-containing protein [Croceibacterium sp.]